MVFSFQGLMPSYTTDLDSNGNHGPPQRVQGEDANSVPRGPRIGHLPSRRARAAWITTPCRRNDRHATLRTRGQWVNRQPGPRGLEMPQVVRQGKRSPDPDPDAPLRVSASGVGSGLRGKPHHGIYAPSRGPEAAKRPLYRPGCSLSVPIV